MQRSRDATEHSPSLAQGVQSRVEFGTHTSLTTPGSTAPSTPKHPKFMGHDPPLQSCEQIPPPPTKMQMFESHSDLSPHGSPKPFLGPSMAASTGAGESCAEASGTWPPPEPPEPPPLPPELPVGSGPAQPMTATKITAAYFIPAPS